MQQAACRSAENALTPASMSVRTHDEKICICGCDMRLKDGTDATATSINIVQHDFYTMMRQMLC